VVTLVPVGPEASIAGIGALVAVEVLERGLGDRRQVLGQAAEQTGAP
jgi:hypothetical protein